MIISSNYQQIPKSHLVANEQFIAKIVGISYEDIAWSLRAGQVVWEERLYTITLSNFKQFTFTLFDYEEMPSFLTLDAEVSVEPNKGHFIVKDVHSDSSICVRDKKEDAGEIPGWIDWFDE